MAIILEERSWPAMLKRVGQVDGYVIAAGKTLKIETTPNGDEILEAEVPAGKKWIAHLLVELIETDA